MVLQDPPELRMGVYCQSNFGIVSMSSVPELPFPGARYQAREAWQTSACRFGEGLTTYRKQDGHLMTTPHHIFIADGGNFPFFGNGLRRLFRGSRRITALLLLLSCAALMSAAHAQNTTGEIDGSVVDASGAAIPGARVLIRKVNGEAFQREVKTNGKGEYAAPLLNVGTYTVEASAKGFKSTTIDNVVLNVGDQLTINAPLQVGSSGESITVEAESVAPELESATQGSVIDEQEMRELALNTRNFEQQILLQPGVVYTGDDSNYPSQVDATGNVNTANISINGLRPTQLSWSLDGGDILNQENSAQVAVFPSVDSIQQTKTLRNSYGAQYGGGGSAQIITVTKSGGSTLHGDAYYFFRNQYLNANNFLNKIASPVVPRPPSQQNIVGFTIGGPLYIPHVYERTRQNTFFFYSQDVRLIHLFPTTRITAQPTIPELNGYTRTTVNGRGATVCIANTTLVTTSPYPGSPCKITTAESPLAAAYVKDIFLP